MDRVPDQDEVVETAFLVLSRVEPQMAAAIWLQIVEEYSLEEIAMRLECTERTVRRWLDGSPATSASHGMPLLGGKAILGIIMTLLRRAIACDAFHVLTHAFYCASGQNVWGTPFTAALLERLRALRAPQDLDRALSEMKAAHQEGRFLTFLRDLLLAADVRTQ